MFTGLVAELGTVRGLKRVQNSYHLTVAARKVLDNLKNRRQRCSERRLPDSSCFGQR